MQLTISETGASFVRPFLLLFTISLLFWTGVNGISAILPLQMQALGYAESMAGWLMGLSSLSAVGVQLTLGGAVDRYGPRPVLVAGGLFLMLSAFFGHARLGVPGQVLLNLVLGVAITLLLIAGLAAASAIAPAAKRGTVVAWYGMANSVAALIAAPLFTLLFTASGFAMAQSLVGLCGLGAGVLSLLVRVRPEAPIEPGGRSERLLLRSALLPALLGALVAVGLGGFMLVAPVRAQALGLVNPGLYLTVQSGALTLSRLAFGPLSDRLGRGWAIVPGLLALAAGFGLMGLDLAPVVALAAPALIGVGMGAASTGLIAWMVERATAAERGRAINTYYLFYEPALFVGSSGMGLLVGAWGEWAYGVVAILTGLGVLIYMVPASKRA